MHLVRGENRYLRTLLYVRRIVHDKLQLMTVKNVHARKTRHRSRHHQLAIKSVPSIIMQLKYAPPIKKGYDA